MSVDRHPSVVVAVLLLIVLTLAGCDDSGEPTIQQALERAQAANSTDEISSVHHSLSYVVSAEGIGDISPPSLAEVDFLAPDRWKSTNTYGTDTTESIVIGKYMYQKRRDESEWRVIELPEESPGPAAWELSSYLDVFISAAVEEVMELPSESIDGVECWRYRVDHNRTLDNALEQLEEATD